MEYTVQEFVAKGLDKVVDTTQPIHATFVTYKNVRGYHTGFVDTDKPGLEIRVENGHVSYDFGDIVMTNIAFAAGNLALADNILEEGMRKPATSAQSVINAGLGNSLVDDKQQTLFVVYVGLMAFTEAMTLTKSMREKVPHSKIVALTCDCSLGMKEPKLKATIDDGQIDAFVVTPACGGRSDMRKILDGLVDAWPEEMKAA